MDGYQYYTANSQKAVKDQLLKAIVDGCFEPNSRGLKHILKVLCKANEAKLHHYTVEISGVRVNPKPRAYLSTVAILDGKTVGILFYNKRDLWIYIKPEHRLKGVANALWQAHIKEHPYSARKESYRPYTQSEPKHPSHDAVNAFLGKRMSGSVPSKEHQE